MRDVHGDGQFVLEVHRRYAVATGVCALVLRAVQGGPLPSWSPGAHIDLDLGRGLVRQYSLCGDPGERDAWEIAVLLEEQSRGGSAYVHTQLTPGRTVRASGPRNLFPLHEADSYLFIAGGIGITPLLPMIAEVSARDVPWRLVYGGRTGSAMAFADDLAKRYGAHVTLLPEDRHGLLPVEELVNGVHDGTAVYCCGPGSLITATEQAHARLGRGPLYVEAFTPKKATGPLATGIFEVEAARSGKVVAVQPEETVLHALSRIDVPVQNSCTEGICGTCEVAVLDGRPEHRDSLLTPEEREAGRTMFVCVSRCLSDRLVLDV